MNIITFGINHKTAPIEIREKLFLNPTQQDLLLSELKSNPAIYEACVLSTCNRLEVYVHAVDVKKDMLPIIHLIFRIKKIPFTEDYKKYFYFYSGLKAVRHLLEVSTGLDSLIIGEEQILGQVKAAFARAQELNMFDRYFNILSHLVVRTGKKAREETKVSFGGSSISWAAVAKAQEVLGDLKEQTILIIGAGKMSELAVGHIQNKQFKKLYLMNRTPGNAEDLAKRYGGEAVPFSDLKEILAKADICICSAGAPHYLVEREMVERIMSVRRGSRLVFIDISMPRNIDPRITGIPNVLLYQIDDLKEVVNVSIKLREHAISDVHRIIESKLSEYQKKINKLSNSGICTISDPLELSNDFF